MFVLKFPCAQCAKMIIQSGIVRVIFLTGEPREASSNAATTTIDASGDSHLDTTEVFEDENNDQRSLAAARQMLREAKVEMVQYIPDRRNIHIDFDQLMGK